MDLELARFTLLARIHFAAWGALVGPDTAGCNLSHPEEIVCRGIMTLGGLPALHMRTHYIRDGTYIMDIINFPILTEVPDVHEEVYNTSVFDSSTM